MLYYELGLCGEGLGTDFERNCCLETYADSLSRLLLWLQGTLKI